MMTEDRESALGFCFSCAQLIIFDPQTAPCVVVDVSSGQPIAQGRRLRPDEPRPDSWVKRVLCDPCADLAEATAKLLGLFPLWPVRQAGR